MVQSCGDISDWAIEEKAFEVSSLENINTEDADFCPLVYEDGIVFVSERGLDLVNGNHYGMSDKPYLSNNGLTLRDQKPANHSNPPAHNSPVP